LAVRSSRAATEPREEIAPTRPLELVDPDEWKRRRRARIAALVALLVLVASPFVIVVMNVQMAQRQIHLQKLRTALNTEQRKYELLREEVLQVSSPAGIAQAAAHYGMHVADNVTVVSVPPAVAPPAGGDGDATLAAADHVTRDKLADAP
jgi:cell division protein FtsL